MTTDTLSSFDVDTEESEAPVADLGPCCTQCGAPGPNLEQTWCKSCGYYAKYGTTVDLEMEGEEVEAEPKPMPAWVKKAGVIFGATLAFSIVARFTLPKVPMIHMVVGTLQLLIGFVLFMALHFIGFLQKSLRDSGAKLMDLLSPFGIWGPVFGALPKTEKRVLAAWLGLCLGFFSLVTGGQPTSWMEFKDTAVKKKEKPQGISVPQAADEGDGDMESAVRDFADKGTRMVGGAGDGDGESETVGGGESPDLTEDEEEEEDESLLDTECLIVGYIPQAIATNGADGSSQGAKESDKEGDKESDKESDVSANAAVSKIRALVVASRVGAKLCVVGYVSQGVTPEVAESLLERFEGYDQEEPAVECRVAGKWLKPKFICKIKYKAWDSKVGLVEPKFDKILRMLP